MAQAVAAQPLLHVGEPVHHAGKFFAALFQQMFSGQIAPLKIVGQHKPARQRPTPAVCVLCDSVVNLIYAIIGLTGLEPWA